MAKGNWSYCTDICVEGIIQFLSRSMGAQLLLKALGEVKWNIDTSAKVV